MRRFLVRPAVWGLLLVAVLASAGLLFVSSHLFRERVASLLTTRLEAYLGRPVTVGDIEVGFLPLTADVYDFTIAGPHPGDRPVVHVPFARLTFSWRALREREVRFEQVDVDRPTVYIEMRPDGTTNLPIPRRRQGGRPARVVVSIGHALVQEGTFQFNDRRVSLTVDARAVWGRLTGGERGRFNQDVLEVSATAQEVVTRLPDARPYPMTFAGRGEISVPSGRVTLLEARAASPALSARAAGAIGWRNERTVDLAFEGEGDTALLNLLGYLEEPITGRFSTAGRYLSGRDLPFTVTGRLRSPGIGILGREIREVESSYAIDRSRVAFDVEKALYAGGRVEGPVTVDLAAPRNAAGRPVEIDLAVHDLSVQSFLRDQFPEQFAVPVPVVELAARGTGPVRYRFLSARPLAGQGRADLVLAPTRERGLPLTGPLPLRLDAGVLSSGPLHLVTGAQTIDGTFTFDLERARGSADYRLVSADLAGLSPLLPPPAAGEEPAFWWPSAGRGTAWGTVAIVGESYTAGVELDLAPVTTPALAADRVTGSLTLTPTAVSGLDLTLLARGGTLAVRGQVPIPQEGRPGTGGLQLAVEAERFPVADTAFFLPAGLGLEEARGRVSGRVDLGGELDALTGRAHVEAADFALSSFPEGLSFSRVTGDVTFDGDRVNIERAAAESPAGVLLARGSFSQGDAENGRLDLMVDAPVLALDEEPLVGLLPSDLKGELSFQATVAGTMERPEVRALATMRRLAVAGRPLGEDQAQLEGTWNGETLTASGRLGELLLLEGGGRLDRRGSALSFDVRSSDLEGLVSLAAPAPLPELSGSLLGTVEVDADFEAQTFETRLRLADLRGEYRGLKLVNREPVEVRLGSEGVSIERLYLGEPEGNAEIVVHGDLGFPGGDAPVSLNLKVQSTLPATWAELALPEAEIGGGLDLLATVRGSIEEPRINGQAVLSGGRFLLPDFPQTIEDASAILTFDSHRHEARLESFRARMGSGTISATGRLDLESLPDQPSYSLNAVAENVGMVYEGLSLRGNANLSLASTPDGRRISGTIDLRRAFYLEEIELNAMKFLRAALERRRLEVAETDDFLATTLLNVGVRGRDALRVNNDLADLRGDIDLSVRGTLARPVVFGTIEITPGGTLRYADVEYTVERGSLSFSNPFRIDPVIDLLARTKVQSFEISIDLAGTLDRLDTKFYTDSDLADLEILTLLATGSQPALSFDAPVVDPEPQETDQLAARAILQGQLTGALSKRVGTLLGFDRFRIDPVGTEGNSTLSSVGLTVGKRLTRDVFVTYTTDPSSRRNLVQVEWQLGKGVTLIGSRNDDGTPSVAVDILWEKRY